LRIVFHEDFHQVYTGDPAAARGRLAPAVKLLKERYEFVAAEPAVDEDVARVHVPEQIDNVRNERKIYPLALLAAGGAIQAARLALGGESALALVRPPGHHASPASCWGFCYFNNMAIAVQTLLDEGAIGSALILDFDLHFGDGTERFFGSRREVQYLHPEGDHSGEWMDRCRHELDVAEPADLFAISAGFDRHIDDWGEILETDDYRTIGRWARQWSDRYCGERAPFAVLEGGYNHRTLAQAAVALCEGMQ
jgi:acetoin utilization deacetylase AcuC-like enzyme